VQAEVQREAVKRDLIAAKFLNEPGKKVSYLQHALDGTDKLLRYERLGCPQPNPSPKALKAFLEERLRDATVM
jgi:hypothetical protein